MPARRDRLVSAATAALAAGLLTGLFLGTPAGRAGAVATTIPSGPQATSPPSTSPPTNPAPATTEPPLTVPTGTSPPPSVPSAPTTSPPRSTPAPVTTKPAATGPRVTYSRGYPGTTYARSTTTAAPTTTTTLAGIGSGGPSAPATLPLVTRGTSAHVSPVFPILSGAGFSVALLIVAARMFTTRRGGADRAPDHSGA